MPQGYKLEGARAYGNNLANKAESLGIITGRVAAKLILNQIIKKHMEKSENGGRANTSRMKNEYDLIRNIEVTNITRMLHGILFYYLPCSQKQNQTCGGAKSW